MAGINASATSNVAGADRPNEALTTHSNSSVSYGKTHPQVNLSKFGQFGWATAPENWATNTHAVSRQMELQVLQTPGGFKAVPGGEALIAAWISLFETHPKTVEGFELGFDYTFEETPFGGNGMIYHDHTDTKRKAINPKTTYVDLYGRPIYHFLNTYMQLVGMNPETKYPDLVTLLDESARPTDYLNDQKAGIVLFWEPDPAHRVVENAVLVVNMMPKVTGSLNMRRDLNQPGELTNLDIDWTGTGVFGTGVQALAQTIMNARIMLNANPTLRPSHLKNISADVAANSIGSNSSLISQLSSQSAAVLGGSV